MWIRDDEKSLAINSYMIEYVAIVKTSVVIQLQSGTVEVGNYENRDQAEKAYALICESLCRSNFFVPSIDDLAEDSDEESEEE